MGGIYSNSELVDTIIMDLNTLPGKLIDGQFIQACSLVSQMAQKLINLRDGIKKDIDNKNKTIEGLKTQLRNAGVMVMDLSPEEFIAEMKEEGAGSNGAD